MHRALTRREVTGNSRKMMRNQQARRAVNRILTSRNAQAVRELYGFHLTNAQVNRVMNKVINTTQNRRLIRSNLTRNKNLNRYNWNKYMIEVLTTPFPWHLLLKK
jgi:hypothetical protein